MSRGMKDSGHAWLGKIPKDWDTISIKLAFNRRSQKNNPIVSKERLSLSIDKGITLYADKTTNLDRFKDDFTQYQIAYPNDIVLNSMNMIVGAIGLSQYFGCVSPVYYVIYPQNDTISVHFYSYLLNVTSIKDLYRSLGKGIYAIDRGDGRVNTCRLKVSYTDFGKIEIPLPTLQEQQAIANFLDIKCTEIDELIALQEQMIEELKLYKQSVITEAVTKGLNPNVAMKDHGIEWIGEIPEHWRKMRVKDICFANNSILSDKTENDYEFLYVDIGSVNYEKGINSNQLYSFKNAPTRARRIASLNDIIVSTVRTYLKAIDIIDTKEKVEYIYSTGFAILSPKKNVSPRYLIHICRSEYFTFQVTLLSNGINYPSINSTNLSIISAMLPPIEEQQQIADYLDSKCAKIDELTSIKQQKIDELKDYKKSIIYEYVTGKKQVNLN